MKKRLLLCLLAASFMFALTACGEKASSVTEGSREDTTAQQQIPIENNSTLRDFERQALEVEQKTKERQRLMREGYPRYQQALAEGYIDPNDPKLTYQDVKDIIESVTNEIPDDGKFAYIDQSVAIMERIRNIQKCADLSHENYNSYWTGEYWPDANTEEERRTCIAITEYASIGEGLTIVYRVYDDSGECVSSETLYDTVPRWEKWVADKSAAELSDSSEQAAESSLNTAE